MLIFKRAPKDKLQHRSHPHPPRQQVREARDGVVPRYQQRCELHAVLEAVKHAFAAVGVALVAVGIWSLRTTRNLHPNQPAEHGPARRGITAVGLLHGLAGTSAVVALVPVTLLPTRTLGIAYLALCGVGVTTGMIVFAVAAAMTLRRAAGASLLLGRRVASLAGLGSIALGCWWLGRVLLAAWGRPIY